MIVRARGRDAAAGSRGSGRIKSAGGVYSRSLQPPSAPYAAAPSGAAAARQARRETHDGGRLLRSLRPVFPLSRRRGAVPRPLHSCGQDRQGRAVRHRDRPGGPRAHGADHSGRRAALADRSRRALATRMRDRWRSVGRRRCGHGGHGARRVGGMLAVSHRAGGCVVAADGCGMAAAAGEAPCGLRRHARDRGGARSWRPRGGCLPGAPSAAPS